MSALPPPLPADLTLAEAQAVIAAGIAAAVGLGIHESIVVVDKGGHVLASARMDTSFPAGMYGAEGKARVAALLAKSTMLTQEQAGAGGFLNPPIPAPVGAFAPVPTLETLQGVFGVGRLNYSQGGVPILRGGVCVGGVGAGGDTSANDQIVAMAAAAVIIH
jgi:glc operon protein GlcG